MWGVGGGGGKGNKKSSNHKFVPNVVQMITLFFWLPLITSIHSLQLLQLCKWLYQQIGSWARSYY